MQIDFREIVNQPLLVFGAIAALIFIKAILLAGLAILFRTPRGAAIETALLLGPAGEFAFVGIGLATQLGLLSANLSSFALAVTSLSMIAPAGSWAPPVPPSAPSVSPARAAMPFWPSSAMASASAYS